MLAKTKLNILEILVSETLIESYISPEEYVPVNNVFKEHDDMKEAIKNPKSMLIWLIL